MKSLVLYANENLRCEERPLPEARENEVLVKIHACGICGSDVNRIMKNGAYHYPLVPGHELSGTVVKVGTGANLALVGSRVAVFPMLPCMECDDCKAGRYNLCKNYNYFGSRCDGGFAEYIAVPVWNLVRLPEGLPLDIAAMCEPVAVAFHAVSRGQIKMGDKVGIAGAGPIGMILSRLAKLAGASDVVLWDIDSQKIQLSKDLGNEHTIDASKTDVSEYIEKNIGGQLDLVIEGTGSSNGLQNCIEVLKKRGSLVIMGNPSKDIILSPDVYWKILRKELTILGTWNSAYCQGVENNWEAVTNILNSDQKWFSKLITHRVRLENGIEPVQMMAQRKELYSKVMYVMED